MKKIFTIITILLVSIITTTAQNAVVEELYEPHQIENTNSKESKTIILSPYDSIKENYLSIKRFIYNNKDNYTIEVKGHYSNAINDCYETYVGDIHVSGNHRRVNKEIVRTLTVLYTQSLDIPFRVEPNESSKKELNIQYTTLPSGKEYRYSNGLIATEYITATQPKNILYLVNRKSQLYKRVYNKVIDETSLKVRKQKVKGENKKVIDNIYFQH